MDDKGNAAIPQAHKKSKKKKKHKPAKTGIQVLSPEQNPVSPPESGNKLNNACLEKKNTEMQLATEAKTSTLSSMSQEKTAADSLEEPISSKKNKSWLQDCRKENSLNRAVEENHSNSLTENTAGDRDSQRTATQDCTDSGPAKQVADHRIQQETAEIKGGRSKRAETSIQAEVCTSAINEQKDRLAMPESVPEVGLKTKAQLKAERKAAFESSQQHDKELQKPKPTSKAERRALQEAQRAKKGVTQNTEAKKDTQISDASTADVAKKPQPPDALNKLTIEKPSHSESPSRTSEKKVPPGKVIIEQRKARLFSHLPQYQWDEDLTANSVIHPAVIKIGLQIAQGLITGANARTVAMLLAFRQVIKDYTTPPQKELSRDLEATLQPFVSFLNKCRPLSAGMENEVKKLKWEINHIPSDMNDADAKKKLCESIDTNVKNDITLAETAICWSICSKISDDDVILTYSCSSVVKGVLAYAHSEGRKFQVIVVDSRPRLEGREMVRYLARLGIPCTYVLINAVSYVMKEVTKVILGAHSLQANGYVMSRVGSSQIALIAQASNVPVLVCCETYKFSERVHTDSFVYNELGNPNDLVITTPPHKCSLENWKEIRSLRLLNLAYDVTPPNLVTAVITDLGMLPCTSVPVVLRVKHVAGQEQ